MWKKVKIAKTLGIRFAAILVIGNALSLNEFSKFANGVDGDELRDDSGIALIGLVLGLIGVAILCRQKLWLSKEWVWVTGDHPLENSRLLPDFIDEVERANPRFTLNPNQAGPLGRLAGKVLGKISFAVQIGRNLPYLGVLGTLKGAVAAVAGFALALGAVSETVDERVDLRGMAEGMTGLQTAFSTSIVCLFMAVWLSLLAHDVEQAAERLLNEIERYGEQRVFPRLRVGVDHLVTVITNRIDQLIDQGREEVAQFTELRTLLHALSSRPHVLRFTDPIQEKLHALLAAVTENSDFQQQALAELIRSLHILSGVHDERDRDEEMVAQGARL
jgi:hypothetical protein